VADLVTRLTKMGSAAIGFDIVFSEPDRLSPMVAADTFRGLDESTREKLRSLPSNDQVLADAIRQSKVILGQSGLPFLVPQSGPAPRQTGLATMGPDPSPYLVTFDGILRNIPVLEEAAAGRGLFTLRAERDGIIRRVPIVMKAQNVIVASLAFEMLRVVTGAGAIIIKTDEAGVRSVVVPGLVLPTDRNGQVWVHFGPTDPARYISAKDVLEGRIAADRVERRLVLIGTSAVGLLDVKTTPLDPVMPGVEVHAQLLESALTDSVLSYPNYAPGAELFIAFVVGVAIIALAPILSAPTLLALGAVVTAFLAGGSWYFYDQYKILLDVTYPLLSSFIVYLTLMFINYFREQVQRRRVHTAFGQYLAPALVEQLAQSHEKLVLGGEERDMTIMFSDVRGFTTISELYKHDPQGLTTLMNRFLTPLTNAIIDHKGTIDKYMGDAIMAFWNAPLHDPTHELNACQAALDMLAEVEKLDLARKEEAKQGGHHFVPLKVGIGINTGLCVVGNMGSDLRFNYSVLGDSVNLASRLEGQTKTYGVATILGSKTAEAARSKFAILELDFIVVKGKTEPEIIYTILGGEEIVRDSHFQKLHELNVKVLSRYRNRDWKGTAEAIEMCRVVDDRYGLKRLYDLYLARIQAFQENPPPPDWNGAFALETK
jgi:adenylate cyclase